MGTSAQSSTNLIRYHKNNHLGVAQVDLITCYSLYNGPCVIDDLELNHTQMVGDAIAHIIELFNNSNICPSPIFCSLGAVNFPNNVFWINISHGFIIGVNSFGLITGTIAGCGTQSVAPHEEEMKFLVEE